MGNILPGVPTPTPKCDSCCKPCPACPPQTTCDSCCPPTPIICGSDIVPPSEARYFLPTDQSGFCVCNKGGKYASYDACQSEITSTTRTCAGYSRENCQQPCIVSNGVCVSPYDPYPFITPLMYIYDDYGAGQIRIRCKLRMQRQDKINILVDNVSKPTGITPDGDDIMLDTQYKIPVGGGVNVKAQITTSDGRKFSTGGYMVSNISSSGVPDRRRYMY